MLDLSLVMIAPPGVYRQRRARLASEITRPCVVFAGQARARAYATNVHPFRAGSNYLYFGGPPVEGAALLIEPGSDGNAGVTLLRNPIGFDDIVWTGDQPGDDALTVAAGLELDRVANAADLDLVLAGRNAFRLLPPCPDTTAWADRLKLDPASDDEMRMVVNSRLCKDEHELEAMRRAARIGVQGQLAAMGATAPGRREADVVGALSRTYAANLTIPSFTPIVSMHGEVLHSDVGTGTLESGRLLLVDAGAEELGGYASDMTRTWPVDGVFSPVQRQLYDTVLRSQVAAIDACVPGARFRDVHDLAARVICEGLVAAEVLKGDPESLFARRAHTLFFVHGLGHLIGLDVHDMEDFGDVAGYAPGRSRRPEFGNKFLRLDIDLPVGCAVTIEPGIYLIPALWKNEELVGPLKDAVNRPLVEQLLASNFGGIRIEDTVVVRSSGGPENLTAALPKEADAVCDIVRGW